MGSAALGAGASSLRRAWERRRASATEQREALWWPWRLFFQVNRQRAALARTLERLRVAAVVAVVRLVAARGRRVAGLRHPGGHPGEHLREIARDRGVGHAKEARDGARSLIDRGDRGRSRASARTVTCLASACDARSESASSTSASAIWIGACTETQEKVRAPCYCGVEGLARMGRVGSLA